MKHNTQITTLLAFAFILCSCSKDPDIINNVPTIRVDEPTSLMRTSVVLNGALTFDGDTDAIETGFILSETSDMEASNAETYPSTSSSATTLYASIRELSPSTGYFYAAYADNGKDRIVTDARSFSTLTISSALLSTPEIVEIETNTIISYIEDDGDSEILAVGFCWSTSPSPTMLNDMVRIEDIDGDSFQAQLYQLKESTTYYIRAFVENDILGNGSVTTSYSEEMVMETIVLEDLDFADSNFKVYLVNNFDSDNDNSISYFEAMMITDIDVQSDNIESLSGIEQLGNLTSLDISGSGLGKGGIAEIDLSSNVNLQSLVCDYNKLTTLDISKNINLTNLSCVGNDLILLDITNNTKLESFDCTNNEDLYGIKIWSDFIQSSYPNFKKDSYVSYITISDFAIIPDKNFRSYLVENFDTDGDGIISLSEADAVTKIEVCTDDIESILGVEYFTNLTSLNVCGSEGEYDSDLGRWPSSGKLTSIDVSKNVKLTYLYCNYNELTSLDISNNMELNSFSCWSNLVSSLDLSQNSKLSFLDCSYNNLTSLDISNNPELYTLKFGSNNIQSLDASKNTNIVRLHCYANNLTYLDISNCEELYYIWCTGNNLKSLDFTNSPDLYTLICTNNDLSEIDVSKNTKLTELSCASNNITSLDISNNKLLTYFTCRSNDNLSKIYVWSGFVESDYANFYKDSQAQYIIK